MVGGEGGAVQDEVGGVLRCSVTQLAGGIAWGCAVHPAAEPRGVSLQAITANQHSDTKVGSGSGLSIMQSGGPMMGGFAEGEVAIANRKIWTFFSEGDVMIDVTGVFPRGFSPWSGCQLFNGWEVEIVQELLPPGDDPGERWASQLLYKDQSGEVSRGHGCDGVDKGELLLGNE